SLGLVVSACAYFNSLYNAKRHFAEAERAAAQGNPGAAYASYGLALEKAAKSLRQSPQGRWADDALFLIARSHFGRSDYPAARAALQRLVAETGDKRIRMGAHAYLGATEYRLANYHAAILHLDAAVEGGGGSGDMLAFAHRVRARDQPPCLPPPVRGGGGGGRVRGHARVRAPLAGAGGVRHR